MTYYPSPDEIKKISNDSFEIVKQYFTDDDMTQADYECHRYHDSTDTAYFCRAAFGAKNRIFQFFYTDIEQCDCCLLHLGNGLETQL